MKVIILHLPEGKDGEASIEQNPICLAYWTRNDIKEIIEDFLFENDDETPMTEDELNRVCQQIQSEYDRHGSFPSQEEIEQAFASIRENT